MLPRARLSRTFVRVLHRKLLSTKDTPAKQTLSHSPSAASSSGQRVSPLEPKTNKGARENRNPLQALGMTLDGPMPVQRSVIDALGPTSFTISGVRVSGSVLIMPDYSTVWNIDDMSQLVPDAFALIKLALPRPDLVLIGTGASTLPVSKELLRFFSEMGVNVEVLNTKNACQTFNVLNQEYRYIAAALLPHGYTANSK